MFVVIIINESVTCSLLSTYGGIKSQTHGQCDYWRNTIKHLSLESWEDAWRLWKTRSWYVGYPISTGGVPYCLSAADSQKRCIHSYGIAWNRLRNCVRLSVHLCVCLSVLSPSHFFVDFFSRKVAQR